LGAGALLVAGLIVFRMLQRPEGVTRVAVMPPPAVAPPTAAMTTVSTAPPPPSFAPASVPTPVASHEGQSMAELEQQLPTVHELWNRSTLTIDERNAKKAQLLGRPLSKIDLKADLERVQRLWNQSIISIDERDALKKKLLEIGQ